jgi:hypothetical protein
MGRQQDVRDLIHQVLAAKLQVGDVGVQPAVEPGPSRVHRAATICVGSQDLVTHPHARQRAVSVLDARPQRGPHRPRRRGAALHRYLRFLRGMCRRYQARQVMGQARADPWMRAADQDGHPIASDHALVRKLARLRPARDDCLHGVSLAFPTRADHRMRSATDGP